MSQACGCRVEWQYEKGQTLSKDYVIYYCPLHQAAPAMREALKWISETAKQGADRNTASYLETVGEKAKQALTQAEGR